MQDILVILVCIVSGMALGRWQRRNRPLMRAADTTSLYAVYGLLFILGARLGGDAALLAQLPVLGGRALCIASFCTVGSVLAVRAIGRHFPDAPKKNMAQKDMAGPHPLSGSLRILACFGLGITLAFFSVIPEFMGNNTLATYALFLLVFAVGIGLGADLQAFGIVRDLHVKILAVPVLVVLGSGAGAILAALALPGVSLKDGMCVGMGLGYYSLSSILIENAGNAALASVALLANLLREVMAILAAPLLARMAGGITTVAASGATAMDTTLPVIARFAGERNAVVAVFSGMTLTLLAPFLVSACLAW